jgi:5-methylcytosine-specific restriction endonuclease McrA
MKKGSVKCKVHSDVDRVAYNLSSGKEHWYCPECKRESNKRAYKKAKDSGFYTSDSYRAYKKNYRDSNKDLVCGWNRSGKKNYRASHQEKILIDRQKRRARINDASINDFNETEWGLLKELYDYRCAYCGDKFDSITMDHIVPISNGGNHTLSNIVPACMHCNCSKHTKTIEPKLKLAFII